MLYLYLVYLDIITVNTTVLFVSTRQRIEQISDIGHGIIIGAISGKKVVKAFQDRFPELLRLYSSFNHSNENNNGELFVFENITGDSINELYNRFSAMINDTDVRRRGPLKEREVSNWLASDLCNHTVEATLEGGSFSDMQTAIDRSDDYILVVKSKRLQAIVPLCKMTNEIASKAISRR